MRAGFGSLDIWAAPDKRTTHGYQLKVVAIEGYPKPVMPPESSAGLTRRHDSAAQIMAISRRLASVLPST